MSIKLIRRVGILFIGLLFAQATYSQQLTRILFIFDASNSMNGKWEGATKIVRAREILNEAVDDLAGIANLEIALRVYGHQSPVTPDFQNCDDTKLEVPFGTNNHSEIKFFINHVQPKGTTPIARSLEACAEDFPDANARNVVILITDGQEACDEFPCEVARRLKAKGINVTPFVVGLGIDLEYLYNLNCIGRIYEASNMESFRKVMKSVINDAVFATSVQFDLMDIDSKPTETNTTLFLYEAGTKNLKYTFMHTMNYQGNPDTITIMDHTLKYDLVVNTLPRVEKKGIIIRRGTHNHIPADCPQGMLQVRILGPTKQQTVKMRVMQKGSGKTLNVQELDVDQKYIVGEYDVEVLTLPRIYRTGVKISQSSNQYIDIPGSGLFKYSTYKAITGQIFVKNNEGTYDWVSDINPRRTTGFFYLQPGEYKVAYRILTAVSTDYTTVKEFRIQSGENTFINL